MLCAIVALLIICPKMPFRIAVNDKNAIFFELLNAMPS